MASPASSEGNFARKIVHGAVRFYYPTLEIDERERLPGSGPLLFVANHANSLIDPVIIGLAANRPVHFLAKAPLFEIPIFGQILRSLGMLPAYRSSDDASKVGGNLQSLADAASYLTKGECVGIFPEGKSHDALKVDKVKSGAARIAVQAIQQGAANVKIIPLGINYERKEKFRSSIWVRVGRPVELDEWKEQIAREERVAQRQLTQEIDQRLKEVVIHLNEEKWEPFVDDLEALVPPPSARPKEDRAAAEASPLASNVKPSSIAALQQRKRIADAINYYFEKDPSRAQIVAEEIQTHRQNLQSNGLNIQSDLFRLRYTRLFLRQTWDFVWMILGFIPALLGTLHNFIPFFLVRGLAAVLPKSNRSIIALTKLGFGIPIYAAWYALVWWRMDGYFLRWVPTAWSVLMFFAGIFALAYCRRGRDAARLWWSELRMLLQKKKLRALRENHFVLRSKLEAMACEFNPNRQATVVPPVPWTKIGWRAVTWILLLTGLVSVSIWGLSKLTFRPLPELAYGGPDLTRLSAASLAGQLEADENALHDVVLGLRELETRVLKIREEFQAGWRDFYRQSDNDLIRQLLLSYANYRTALLRLIWKYQRNAELNDEKLRLRAFLIAYVSGCALYETSLKFITYFQDSPEAVRKLNEAEPLWGIPAGMFDSVQRDIANAENRRVFAEASATYQKYKALFARHGLVENTPHAFFHELIPLSIEQIQRLQPAISETELTVAIGQAHATSKEAIYRTKTLVSAWIGDTKIREPREGQSLIQPAVLEEFRQKLQPGDILLERRNWFLSNAFLPGFWPHAALYVGTPADLQKLGLDQDPRLAGKWREFIAKDAEGHAHVIIESVSEGVIFSSLEHSIGGADSAAVLRPRLSEEKMREAIARAFSHVGKPYDFEFDFFSTDKLVCTELVFRSYDGSLDFPLVTILGTKTMPAIAMVQKFNQERGQPEAQLAFVAFLDGEEAKGKAQFKDEEAFSQTVDRPALTWLQKN